MDDPWKGWRREKDIMATAGVDFAVEERAVVAMTGETPAEILARIDERTKTTQRDVDEIKKNIQSQYVSSETFKALVDKVNLHQRILFGVIGLMCVTMLGALFKLVIMPGPFHGS